MHYPPESGECPPQLHNNITTLITLQSGFEWFELSGLFEVVPVVQAASVCFCSFLVVFGGVTLFRLYRSIGMFLGRLCCFRLFSTCSRLVVGC